MRFTIRLTDNVEYKVSVPDYEGGEVVTADEHASLADKLSETLAKYDDALMVLEEKNERIRDLEAVMREAVTYLNDIEIPDVAEEDRCINVIRRLNAVLTPSAKACVK